jgi:hypothetical protein
MVKSGRWPERRLKTFFGFLDFFSKKPFDGIGSWPYKPAHTDAGRNVKRG